jgi:hypothetical protein
LNPRWPKACSAGSVPEIKGSVVRSRLAFVEDQAGRGTPNVSAGCRSNQVALTSLLATKWYPFDLGRQISTTPSSGARGRQTHFFLRLGEASAERT